MFFRLLKLGVSAVVFAGDAFGRRWRKLLHCPVAATCVFMTYHTITEGTRERFARQLAMLKGAARLVASLENPTLEPGGHYVGVTFDDAFRSFADNALPVLAEAKVPVILFVPTGYLGRKSAWFDYGGDNPVGEEVLSADELKQLVKRYQIEIGSHTVNHPNMVEISQDEARAELCDSRRALELMLGREINCLSFPYGSYGVRELQLAEEAGYDFCFSVSPQTLVGSIQTGLIGRVSVQPTDWPIEFRLKSLGAYRWEPRARFWKSKLVHWISKSA